MRTDAHQWCALVRIIGAHHWQISYICGMKGQNTNCRECGTQFEKKRDRHFYCSKRCCNEYNRKKRGDPLPEFLRNKKKPGAAITSAIASPSSQAMPTNPIYSGVLQMGVTLEREEHNLQLKKQRLLSKYYKVKKKIDEGDYFYKNIASGVGLVAGVKSGFDLAESITDSPVIKTILGVAFGGAAGYAGQQLFKNADGKEIGTLRRIEYEINEIDARLNTIGLKKVAVRGFKRSVPKHTKHRGTVLSAKEFNSIDNPSYTFTHKWEILGRPEKNFTMMVYGQPDAGKSHFAVQFASYLSQLPMSEPNHVLFIPFEERDSNRLQQKFRRYGFKGSVLPYGESLDDVINAISEKKPKFIFIDSINEAGIDKEGLKQIKMKFPKLAIIAVIQMTKDGKFKGSKEIEHFSNIKVKVVKTQSGNIAQITGKYSSGQLAVFDDNDFGNRVISSLV